MIVKRTCLIKLLPNSLEIHKYWSFYILIIWEDIGFMCKITLRIKIKSAVCMSVKPIEPYGAWFLKWYLPKKGSRPIGLKVWLIGVLFDGTSNKQIFFVLTDICWNRGGGGFQTFDRKPLLQTNITYLFLQKEKFYFMCFL